MITATGATLDLDDSLVARARAVTGLTDLPDLIHEALKALIGRESARRLVRLGASELGLRPALRRRPSEP